MKSSKSGALVDRSIALTKSTKTLIGSGSKNMSPNKSAKVLGQPLDEGPEGTKAKSPANPTVE